MAVETYRRNDTAPVESSRPAPLFAAAKSRAAMSPTAEPQDFSIANPNSAPDTSHSDSENIIADPLESVTENPYSDAVQEAAIKAVSGEGSAEERKASLRNYREEKFNMYLVQSSVSCLTTGTSQLLSRTQTTGGADSDNRANSGAGKNPYLNLEQQMIAKDQANGLSADENEKGMQRLNSYIGNAKRSAAASGN